MGVSINQWRNAIGCHCFNSCKIRTKPFNTSSSTFSTTRKRLFLWILTIIGLFTILTYAVFTSSILHSTRPPPASQPMWTDSASTSSSQWPTSSQLPTWQTLCTVLCSSWQPHSPVPWLPPWPPPWPTALPSSWPPPSPVPWSPSCPPPWTTCTSSVWLGTWSPSPPPVWTSPSQSLCKAALGYQPLSSPSCSTIWSPATSQSLLSNLLSNKKRNKLVKARNGNRQNRGIKIAHWNAGSAHLVNKIHEIEQVVAENHPHLLGISESNLKRAHDLDDVQLQDYDLILSKTIDNDQLQVSRIVCYKHHSLVGKVREDLMSDEFSSIWLEIGLPGKRKILVCQLYREWRYLGQADRGEHSHSMPEQIRRWSIFLDQWEQAVASGKEVIVMGDINLDFLKFGRAGNLQPLVDLLMERIYPHGVVQCVQGPTHFWPGQVPSGLDHIYTNIPDKLSKVQVKGCGSSDHSLILATRYAKNIRQNIKYCKKRSYKNFDKEKFLEEVGKISWWEVYSSTDVDIAVDIFTNKLTEILDRMAPIRKFQIRTKYAAWVGEDTKEKMQARNIAQQSAAISGLEEDWERYRLLRNQVTAQLRKDKIDWQQKKLETCEQDGDSGKLWKNILGWLSWSSSNSPSKLLSQGNLETSPSRMAEIQNRYYIEKVQTIRRNLQGLDWTTWTPTSSS